MSEWILCKERLPEPRRLTRKTPNGILILDEKGRIERLREVTECTVNYMKHGPRLPKKFEGIAGPKIIAWIDMDEWDLPKKSAKPEPPK